MKKIHIQPVFFVYLVLAFSLIAGCKKDDSDDNPASTVKDADGNVYHTLTIGTQTWMVENLKTTKYRNGNPIPQVADSAQWIVLTTGAFCYYDNTSTIGDTYGLLYNWFAVNDPRNIAPKGWHVATSDEWNTLNAFLGGEMVSGGKLKETGSTHWNSPYTSAKDEVGFKALPGGGRTNLGNFQNLGKQGLWWTSTENNAADAWPRGLSSDFAMLFMSFSLDKNSGFTVRCIKD